MTTMIEAALEYVKDGFKVFPVKADKKPLTEHGLKDATQTTQGVKEYWTKWPDAGIGIVTDNLVVLDFDAKSGGLDSMETIKQSFGLPDTRIHGTGGGGFHYIYLNPNGDNIRNTTGLGGYPGVDLRANGGYIVAPPSHHPSGNDYYWYNFISPSIAPQWLMTMATKKPETTNSGPVEGEPIPEGQRNSILTKMAGAMRRQGMTGEEIETALLIANKRCQPEPLPENEIKTIAKSVSRYQPVTNGNNSYKFNTLSETDNSHETFQNRDKTVTNSVQSTDSERRLGYSARFDEVLAEAGKMSRRDISLSIGLQHTSDTFRQIVSRRLRDGIIRPWRGSSETLEWVNRDYKVLTLADYRKQANLSITLPLNLNKYVNVPAGSVIGVAGYTSAGKTAFLLEIAELNVTSQDLPIYHWFNEMSEDRMLLRLEDYPALVTELGNKFKAIKQTDFEFYDVIEPDAINIIDYLDLDGEGENQQVYMIGAVIKKLQRRLGKGIVIFALQKKNTGDMGYGGVYSAKLSNLYLALDTVSQSEISMEGKCKIVKAKDWSEKNPVGLYCHYYTGGKHGKIMSDNLWRRDNAL